VTLTHPLADRGAPTPAAVTGPDGGDHTVDDDGVVACPPDLEGDLAERLAEAYGVDAGELRDGGNEICGAEMSNGSTCERPADDCPYHGDGQEE